MDIFSPLHEIKLPCAQSIWVKRDDLIDPYVSGNKWRKLKYILGAAREKGKTHLVTFGGAYSNHLVATAAAAAKFELKSTAFVRGEEVNNEMLLICRLFGMDLIFTDRDAYRYKQDLFSQNFGNDDSAYFVDEGGASAEAIAGCAEIIQELPVDFDHIFCAAGTGTTAMGLLQGILKYNHRAKLHIIPVLKGASFIDSAVAEANLDKNKIIVHHGYHFGGYAKTTPELLTFIKLLASSTGILTDPVYTGKMFYAINNLSQQNEFEIDAKILAIHTGGLLGILGMKEKIYKTFTDE